MAKKAVHSSKVKLVIFLLGMGLLVTTSLYFDARHKLGLLASKVTQLEESQVLLMVPDEQAQAIASWLASHPEQTQSLLETAVSGEQVSLTMGPGANTPVNKSDAGDDDVPLLLRKNEQDEGSDGKALQPEVSNDSAKGEAKRDTAPKLAPQLVAEGQDGVRVIKLPHGGIRVTTREDK